MATENLDQFLTDSHLEASTSAGALMEEVTQAIVTGNVEGARQKFEEASHFALRIQQINAIRADVGLPSAAYKVANVKGEPVLVEPVIEVEEQQPEPLSAKEQDYTPRDRVLSILAGRSGKPTARRTVLELYLLNPEESSHHIREIARRTGREINEIRRELNVLESLGLFASEWRQSKRVYSLSKDPHTMRGLIAPLTTLLRYMRGDEDLQPVDPATLPISVRDRMVRELREQGVGPSQIAKETGLSFSLVLSSMSRIKYDEVRRIYAKQLTDTEEYVQKVRELRSKGYYQREMRQQLGITKSQLDRLVHIILMQDELGEGESAEELEKAKEELSANLTFTPEVIIPIPAQKPSKEKSSIGIEEHIGEGEFGALSRIDIYHIAEALFLNGRYLKPFLEKKGIRFIERDILNSLLNLAGDELANEIASKSKDKVKDFLYRSRVEALEKAKAVVSAPDFELLVDRIMEIDPNVGCLLIHLSELNEIVKSGDKEGLTYMQSLQGPQEMVIVQNRKTGMIESVKFRPIGN